MTVRQSLKAIQVVLKLLSYPESQGLLAQAKKRLEIPTDYGPVVLEFEDGGEQ